MSLELGIHSALLIIITRSKQMKKIKRTHDVELYLVLVMSLVLGLTVVETFKVLAVTQTVVYKMVQ